jgi:hypothetical protein
LIGPEIQIQHGKAAILINVRRTIRAQGNPLQSAVRILLLPGANLQAAVPRTQLLREIMTILLLVLLQLALHRVPEVRPDLREAAVDEARVVAADKLIRILTVLHKFRHTNYSETVIFYKSRLKQSYTIK